MYQDKTNTWRLIAFLAALIFLFFLAGCFSVGNGHAKFKTREQIYEIVDNNDSYRYINRISFNSNDGIYRPQCIRKKLWN